MAINITCENCGEQFELSVHESIIYIYNNKYILKYIYCDKCKKIYRLYITDEKYDKLVDDLNRAKERIKRNWGKTGQQMQELLIEIAMKKKERLKAYINGLNQKYSGVFEFATPNKNGEQQVIYRENVADN